MTPNATIAAPQGVAEAFPKREPGLNKYTVGTVAVIGGSSHFNHAPVIAGLGARAAGAGLVHLVVPDASRIAAGAMLCEATFVKLTPTCVPPKADVTVVGNGLGISQGSEMLVSRVLSGSAGCFVLDADALNILASWYAAKPGRLPTTAGQQLVLTPHSGEAARLLACKSADIDADRPGAARELVERYRAVVVLKGPHTIVASPEDNSTFVCQAGNPFMALGGMGDLLAGVVAARWARLAHLRADNAATAFAAAMSATWLHSTAADALVQAAEPVECSVAETARKIASIRIALER